MTLWTGSDGPPRWRWVRSALSLAAISYGVAASVPHPALHGRGLAVTLLLAASVAGWLTWLLRSGDPRVSVPVGLVANGVAGTALTVATPHSPAIALAAVAVVRVATLWPVRWSVAFGAGLTAAYLVGHVAIDDSSGWLVAGVASFVTAMLIGLVRRQGDQLATGAYQAQVERARSAALDERARIAREIHDVLAHSLAALSVQLETADALLESGRAADAHTSVLRASQLAKEGIGEVRRAIGALRGDTLPLPRLLATLTTSYQEDLAAPARVEIDGEPRELRADVSLTLYRTAQEAITNVRKHAPGAPVEVALAYRRDGVELAVTNGPGPDADRPPAGSGGGYGLAGPRERAELAGGTMTAAPAGDGWRVDVTIPG